MEDFKELKKFNVIDYPALVENHEEAIHTLGGRERVYQAFARKHSKLLLNFTPDNIFSKMICSSVVEEQQHQSSNEESYQTAKNDKDDLINNSHNNNNDILGTESVPSRETTLLKDKDNDLILPCLLMKVKKVNKTEGDASTQNTEFKTEIIGKIKRIYGFSKMADFQYLPMANYSSKIGTPNTSRNSNRESLSPKSGTKTQFSYNSFYDNFLFNNIDNYQQELKVNNIPQLFILPPFFSRFDDPINYAFKSEPVKKGDLSDDEEEVIEKEQKSPIKTKSKSKEFGSDSDQEIENASQSDDEFNNDDKNDESKSEKSSSAASSPRKKSTSSSGGGTLIKSRRQERNSQAILVTYSSKEIPPSELFIFKYGFILVLTGL
jgi:hypothetical protein